MTLVLYQHPFASYCQKVLIALYELGLEFESRFVEGEEDRAALAALWPLASIPVLRDDARDVTLPETTVIIEYLDGLAPGGPMLIPSDPAAALDARLWDRFGDLRLGTPMQKIVADALRPDGQADPFGVDEARAALDAAYPALDARLADRTWLAGDAVSLADCAAAPCLFYLRALHRWSDVEHPHVARYYRELLARPSVAQVVEEARPYRDLFPLPWPDDMDDV